jgi:tetratricopeptide (TPR) repeat protein
MQYHLRQFGCLLFALALSAFLPLSAAVAQSGGGVDQTGTGGRHTIQGRIYFPSGRRSDARVAVKLESVNTGGLSVFSDSNGSFSFRGLEAGSYTVVVDGGNEYETARESVYIEGDASNPRLGVVLPPVSRLYTVEINLRPKRGAETKVGVVNAALAAVPETARDLYRKALESAQAGDNPKAIEQLKAAIAIYPSFPLALNELGVQYLKVGQVEKAAAVLKSAVKLSPEDFQPRLHYGIALLNEKKFGEAEEQLRVAVDKNSSAPTAHMYLGITLAIQRKLDEGNKELETAVQSKSPEVALAYRYLGGICVEKREYKRAAEQLETYLKLVPKAPDSQMLRQTISELRNKK